MTEFKHDVFVSFAWEGQEHQDRVRILVGMLRGCGFDVVHDETHVPDHPGLYEFMERGIADSRHVLCVCTKAWFDAANNRTGHQHPGVCQEVQFIRKRTKSSTTSAFIFPVVFDETLKDDAVPASFTSRLVRTVPSEFSALLTDLCNFRFNDLHAVFGLLDALRAGGAAPTQPDDPHIRLRNGIDERLATRGSAFNGRVEAHPLTHWATMLTQAFIAPGRDADLLEHVTKDLLDAHADAGLSTKQVDDWATEHFHRVIWSGRRPWVASIELATSGNKLEVTSARWLRPGLPPVHLPGVSGSLDTLAGALAKGVRPSDDQTSSQVVRFLVPAARSSTPLHRTRDDFGAELGLTYRAVTIWPFVGDVYLNKARCPARGEVHVHAVPRPHQGNERLRVVQRHEEDVPALLPTHGGHVLTAAVPEDPETFATAWRGGDDTPPVHRAFDIARAWLNQKRDVYLIWTDDQYPIFEPGELTP
jgi:hypothetical protein